MILVYSGLIVMVLGTLKTVVTREFRMKLHFMGISDVAGLSLVMVGLLIERFGVPKILLGYSFMIVWIPLVTHALAKAYISRLKR